MDSGITSIINRALDGARLGDREIAALFRVEDLSEEAFAIQQAGRRFTAELCNGKGEIHGQIGINAGPCPKDCKFCSFAVSNKVFSESSELSMDEIIEGVSSMLRQGANAIYIMETAHYPFEKFLAAAKAVKSTLATDIPLIANAGDFDDDGARALVEAGFTGVYHVVRMGEGIETKINVSRRWKTIEAAKAAGLLLGACVEPVGPEHSIEELVEKTVYTREMEAVFSGAMRRTLIPTSPLATYGQVSLARMATIVGAVALATGTIVPGNCTHEPNLLGVQGGANLIWAEVGSNPRDMESETVRGWTVNRCREVHEECGWEVLEGPSLVFSK